MDLFTFGIYLSFAMAFGMAIGFFFTLQAAKAGKLKHEGITYSYFRTQKYRMHKAMRETR